MLLVLNFLSFQRNLLQNYYWITFTKVSIDDALLESLWTIRYTKSLSFFIFFRIHDRSNKLKTNVSQIYAISNTFQYVLSFSKVARTFARVVNFHSPSFDAFLRIAIFLNKDFNKFLRFWLLLMCPPLRGPVIKKVFCC